MWWQRAVHESNTCPPSPCCFVYTKRKNNRSCGLAFLTGDWLLFVPKPCLVLKWEEKVAFFDVSICSAFRTDVVCCLIFNFGFWSGCGSSNTVHRPLMRRLVGWSPRPPVFMLKYPWARFWTLNHSQWLCHRWVSVCMCEWESSRWKVLYHSWWASQHLSWQPVTSV